MPVMLTFRLHTFNITTQTLQADRGSSEVTGAAFTDIDQNKPLTASPAPTKQKQEKVTLID